MDHKIQYSDIWISMAWAPLKKITGPADQRRTEFYWSTGSYSGHGLAVLLVCWQFQWSWTSGPAVLLCHWQFKWSWTTGPAVLLDHTTHTQSRIFKPSLFILFLLSLLHQQCRRHHGLALFQTPSSGNHQEAEQLPLHPARRADNSSGTRKGRQVWISYIYDRINTQGS